jgi:hypothetical protein
MRLKHGESTDEVKARGVPATLRVDPPMRGSDGYLRSFNTDRITCA